MYYKDNPKDIRNRTVGSRKPPPTTTHLLKGDPDSATSPSKYSLSIANRHPHSSVAADKGSVIVPKLALAAKDAREDDMPGYASTSDGEAVEQAAKRKRLRKRKGRKGSRKMSPAEEEEEEEEEERTAGRTGKRTTGKRPAGKSVAKVTGKDRTPAGRRAAPDKKDREAAEKRPDRPEERVTGARPAKPKAKQQQEGGRVEKKHSVSSYELADYLSKKKVLNNIDISKINTMMEHANRLRKVEEGFTGDPIFASRKPGLEDDDLDDDDIEEVEGSLTSASSAGSGGEGRRAVGRRPLPGQKKPAKGVRRGEDVRKKKEAAVGKEVRTRRAGPPAERTKAAGPPAAGAADDRKTRPKGVGGPSSRPSPARPKKEPKEQPGQRKRKDPAKERLRRKAPPPPSEEHQAAAAAKLSEDAGSQSDDDEDDDGARLPLDPYLLMTTEEISPEEMEKKIRSMKHIPPPPPPQQDASKIAARQPKLPSTGKADSTRKVALPPVVVPDKQTKKQFKNPFASSYDKMADLDFYKDFKFTYVRLPVPTNELPREYYVYELVFISLRLTCQSFSVD